MVVDENLITKANELTQDLEAIRMEVLKKYSSEHELIIRNESTFTQYLKNIARMSKNPNELYWVSCFINDTNPNLGLYSDTASNLGLGLQLALNVSSNHEVLINLYNKISNIKYTCLERRRETNDKCKERQYTHTIETCLLIARCILFNVNVPEKILEVERIGKHLCFPNERGLAVSNLLSGNMDVSTYIGICQMITETNGLVFDTIDTLDLSTRTYTCFYGRHVCVADILILTEDELLSIYGIGPKRVEEIRQALIESGYSRFSKL